MCRACNHRLRLAGGAPDFAEHIAADDPGFSRAQRVMNSAFFARLYESPLWRPLHTRLGSGLTMGEEVREVIAMAGERPVSAAADLACGTGHYARALARRWPGAVIYGLDISPGMLARGRHLAARENLEIMFLRGDIHRLPFETASLDHVNCSGTLHLLPDLGVVWGEVYRALAPGGVFTAMIVGRAEGFLGRRQQKAARRWGTTFTTPDRLERELKSAGFASFSCRPHRLVLLFSAEKQPREERESRG